VNLADLPCSANSAALGPRFAVYAPTHPRRAAVERFIQAIYDQHYGAVLRAFKPFLAVIEHDGRVCAAAGYRDAVAPLFLERYLTAPVEEVLARHTGWTPQRSAIVEVGHFASAQPGQGRQLMAALGRHLAARGYQFVVSTATRELRTIFSRLRMDVLELGSADPSVLGTAAADWGSYYEHAPQVLAGEIHRNLARFAPVA
jgi:hypothetical protein